MSTPSCFHCGLPNFNDSHSLVIDQQPRFFCCLGCLSAAQTILDAGLQDYYKYHQPNQLPAQTELTYKQKSTLLMFDDSLIQAEFVTQIDNARRQALCVIEGISCSACSWLIEKRVLQLPGVEEARVNLSNHRLTVQWVEDQIKLSDILLAIKLIGYTASPFVANQEDKANLRTQRRYILRLGLAGIGTMQTMMTAIALYSGSIADRHERLLWLTGLIVSLPVLLVSARPFFISGWYALKQRQITMDVSISIALLSAFFASSYATLTGQGEVYFESINMFAFFIILSRFLEFRARTGHLANANHRIHLPQSCTKITEKGAVEVAVATLIPGDRIQLIPGELCPIDGQICHGQSEFDESTYSGEFKPIEKKVGDTVYSGTTNMSQPVKLTVTQTGANNSYHLLQQLTERASSEKSRLTQLANRGAQQFIWSSLIIALVIGIAWLWIDPKRAFWIVISVLVVTCPCALSLATPTAIAQATLRLKQRGFICTRGYVLERLTQINAIAFDKTGTLTQGRFSLTELTPHSSRFDTETLTQICAHLEQTSQHSIAQAFAGLPANPGFELRQITHHLGLGIEAYSDHGHWQLGSAQFTQCTVAASPNHVTLCLTLNQTLLATLSLKDPMRSHLSHTFEQLKQLGIDSHVLTGDSNPTLAPQYTALGLTGQYHAGLSPQQKLDWLTQHQHQQTAVVGDGLNDAPMLAGAQLSIAMSEATDLAKTQADVILLSDQLPTLVEAIQVAKYTQRIIRQNLIWALIYNLLALPIAAFGWITPWQAAIGMSLSSLIVVGNALRIRSPSHTSSHQTSITSQ